MAAIAWISIAVALGCALWMVADVIRHPQKMAVMNVVWPVSALYGSVFAVWIYLRIGRPRTKGAAEIGEHGNPGRNLAQIALSTSHCAAGCALADLICEFSIAATGITLLGSVLWAEYAIDLGAAWAIGILFQYFAIKPMRDMSAGQALMAAVKADTLSIVAFQVGMYAWMALTHSAFFPSPHLTAFDPRYWLMMQIAMICGFATSFPVNAWLLRSGLKEPM